MDNWQPIETAPKDGRPIKVRRMHDGQKVFEGRAAWRNVVFPAFINGVHGLEPAYEATGWMMPAADKRVPEPTHWMPA